MHGVSGWVATSRSCGKSLSYGLGKQSWAAASSSGNIFDGQQYKRNTMQSKQYSSTVLFSGVESFTLEALGPDHDSVGQELADSLQEMLDTEWMPQGVHGEVAMNVKETYISCRRNGEDDLMTIMMTTASNLTDKWTDEWESDMFVNVWDIANYVSDYLTTKAGSDGCECTQKIY